jgi:K+/H+ antiporter YhaU regulatory subunit KhtT
VPAFVFQQNAPQRPSAPELPSPPAPPGLADIGNLAGQLAELTIQQAQLRAQHDGLKRQLEQMQQQNPARPGIQQEWAQVGSQLAAVDGKIAAVNARLRQDRQATGAADPDMRDNGGHRGDPDLPIAGGIAIMLALILPLSIAYAIRMLRRNPAPTAARTEDFSPRFDRLEQAVDAIAIEVERVSEGQRFVTKILAERPAVGAGSPEPLALGAGAAEPVRVDERQGVRQSR